MKKLAAQWDVLEDQQKTIALTLGWTTVEGFALYGGTAIALRYGHRTSEDFDFFTEKPLNKAAIVRHLEEAGRKIRSDQNEVDTLVLTTMPGNVKLSFFGSIAFGRVGAPDFAPVEPTSFRLEAAPWFNVFGGLTVASPLDLFGTKLAALLNRVEAKDYIDVAELLRAGLSLGEGLAAATALYGQQFTPTECLRALTYFEGGDLARVDEKTRMELREASAQVRSIPEMRVVSKSLGESERDRQAKRDAELEL